MSSELERRLRRAWRGDPDPEEASAHASALESRVMAAFEARVPKRRARWGVRVGVTLGVGAALVGACRLPVEYDLPVGHRIVLTLPDGDGDDFRAEGLAEFLRVEYPVEELSVRVESTRRHEPGATPTDTTRMAVDMLGVGLDIDEICDDVRAEFEWISKGEIECESLEGRVRGTLGGKLSSRWLDMVIDEHGVEEAKRRILADLAARGLEGDARIEVQESTGPDGEPRREVRVEVEAHRSSE